MGFSFKPFKAITRGLGIPDKAANLIGTIAFPMGKIGDVSATALGNYLVGMVSPDKPAQQSSAFPGASYNIYGGSYGAPPAYSVYFQEEGRHTPWDYSMDSSQTSLAMWSEPSPMNLASVDSWETHFQTSLRNQ